MFTPSSNNLPLWGTLFTLDFVIYVHHGCYGLRPKYSYIFKAREITIPSSHGVTLYLVDISTQFCLNCSSQQSVWALDRRQHSKYIFCVHCITRKSAFLCGAPKRSFREGGFQGPNITRRPRTYLHARVLSFMASPITYSAVLIQAHHTYTQIRHLS